MQEARREGLGDSRFSSLTSWATRWPDGTRSARHLFRSAVEMRSAFMQRRMTDLGVYLRAGWAAAYRGGHLRCHGRKRVALSVSAPLRNSYGASAIPQRVPTVRELSLTPSPLPFGMR